jgi:peptidoglycan hydrolase-like protein with peptidoglycan-binding domain
MKIVSRAGWGARAPRSRLTTTWAKRTEFIVHYSDGPTGQTPRQIQNFHMDDPEHRWVDIGYNFLVDRTGRIYEGRGWLTIGAQAHEHNTSGIGVCFIGEDGNATDAARVSIRALYDLACVKAGRTLLQRGHGQLSGNSTDCPGHELLAWVKAGMPTGPAWPGRFLVYKSGHPVMTGPDVTMWKHRMLVRGWETLATGGYDKAAADMCEAFQREKGLTVDGVVGRDTWNAAWTTPIT